MRERQQVNKVTFSGRSKMLRLTQRSHSNLPDNLIQPSGRERTVKEGILEEVTLNCSFKDKQQSAR